MILIMVIRYIHNWILFAHYIVMQRKQVTMNLKRCAPIRVTRQERFDIWENCRHKPTTAMDAMIYIQGNSRHSNSDNPTAATDRTNQREELSAELLVPKSASAFVGASPIDVCFLFNAIRMRSSLMFAANRESSFRIAFRAWASLLCSRICCSTAKGVDISARLQDAIAPLSSGIPDVHFRSPIWTSSSRFPKIDRASASELSVRRVCIWPYPPLRLGHWICNSPMLCAIKASRSSVAEFNEYDAECLLVIRAGYRINITSAITRGICGNAKTSCSINSVTL